VTVRPMNLGVRGIRVPDWLVGWLVGSIENFGGRVCSGRSVVGMGRVWWGWLRKPTAKNRHGYEGFDTIHSVTKVSNLLI
jgi:hypothetical protein